MAIYTSEDLPKVSEENLSQINSGVAHPLPTGFSYDKSSGEYLDVYLNGQLLREGTGNDYIEDTNTSIKFLFNVPANSNLTYIFR